MAMSDRYEIDKSMGEGGFARVFRGQEKATGRAVALKVLKSAFYQNAEVRERFQREVFAVASIQNPHIVGMYDFNLASDDLYIAMEYVPGHTLRERIVAPFDLATRFSILSQIADALRAAHERNVVHRDLKPENVKVIEDGAGSITVKVLDFGMAKLNELEERLELEPLTRAGICFGTPQYMSPEQIRGKLDDKSIDLFALAIIAYELLSGGRPWDGEQPYEVMRAVLNLPAPPIQRLFGVRDEEQLSAARLSALNAFFARALAKRLADRPEDATTFITELEAALFEGGCALRGAVPVPSRERRSDDTVEVCSHLAPTGPLHGVSAVSDASGATEVVAVEDRSWEHTTEVAEVAPEPVRVEVDRAVREEAVRAAKAFSASRRAERSFGKILFPLLVLAALGGSVGYLLAGSASAQSSQVHDFIVGK